MVIQVVPHEGTWIEIYGNRAYMPMYQSFPTRERGLKFIVVTRDILGNQCRSPRGNVD